MKRTSSFLTLLMLAFVCMPVYAQYYATFTTRTDGTQLLDYATGPANSSSGKLISLQKNTKYQTMDGFGYAVTYSACFNLMQMRPRDRHAFLMRTFSPQTGFGASYVRMSIGCSDFSSTEYSLCDTQGLSNFRLHSDELDYVIPVLHEILAINPEVKIIGSPWTCPRWMKVKDLSSSAVYNSWTSGQLNPLYYDDYAQYFVKFVEAMRAEGISIYAVTPQNEPLNRGNSASLYMPWEDEAAFLKHLAPAFKQAGIDTKIYVFDHNYNYDNISSQEDYPIKLYNALDADLEGGELVAGSAWHNYGGSNSELDDIHSRAPRKEMIFTEASIGTWNDGRNLSARLLSDFNDIVLGTVNRYCSAVIVWNLMLDLKRGPNRDGGCTTCFGAVDIDESDYHTISANSHYYMISHMAAVVRPGAVRIGYQTSVSGLSIAAFQNPDGSYGVVLSNNGSSGQDITVMGSDVGYAPVSVPAKSVVSVLLTNDNPDPEMRIGSQSMERTDIGRYCLTLDLEQGQTLGTSFLADAPEEWYVDPDFLETTADGDIKLLALSGSYTLRADLNERSLMVEPAFERMDAQGQGNLYIIGASASVGKPYYVGGEDWKLERAIPMAEVADKVYQATLTVGEQLATSGNRFAIYGSNQEWTPQFMGRAGSDYRLTCSSVLFGMGTGSLGNPDGTVFQRMPKLDVGDTYRFTVDLTEGVSAGVLTIDKVTPTGISTPRSNTEPVEQIYDLSGRRLPSPRPGINIEGGRKILRPLSE